MILDALLTLSDAQAITADAVSTNTIDLGNVTPKIDPGPGEPMAVVFTVDVAADFTTGDEVYSFELIMSAAAALTSPTVIARRTLTAAQLVAGRIFWIPFPGAETPLRYLGVNYDVGGTTPTITVSAYVVPLNFVDQLRIYAKGYVIS